MANISDIIEQFLLKTLDDSESINISRNELANYFSCAPSQINYVLTTRFSVDKGFCVESRRGGGGFITLLRLSPHTDDSITELINQSISDGISYSRASDIIDRFVSEDFITEREGEIIKSSISDKALVAPFVPKENLRAGILKSILLKLLQLNSENAQDKSQNENDDY